jgi:hypothetical protein
MRRWLREEAGGKLLAGFILATLLASAATAQYSTSFESFMASPTPGTLLTGQDLFYNPVAGSLDYDTFTTAGNAPGFAANPNGGAIFVAGINTGAFARAQRDIPYGAGTGIWTAGFDCAILFQGTLPAANNIGSFSLQPSTGGRIFIALARWTATATAVNWNADYVYYDVAGTQVTALVPDPGFQNLNLNKWYRWETDWDFDTNRILELRLQDLTTGVIVRHNPTNWYLQGGASPALGGFTLPTAFRFFTGGGGGTVTPGNLMAFDNVTVRQRPQLDLAYAMDPVTTTVTLDVKGGPAGGAALLFYAFGTMPPFYLPGGGLSIEPIRLAVLTLNAFGGFAIGPAGTGSAAIPYPTSIGLYNLYFQGATLSGTGALDILNAVGGAQDGVGPTNLGALSYNHKSGKWEIDVIAPAGTTVDVVRVDAMGAEVAPPLLSTTVPGPGTLSVAGEVSAVLAFGEKVRLKLNGVTFREVNG